MKHPKSKNRRRRVLAAESLESRCLLAGDLTLVHYFDTWNGGIIPSSDPAGITYHGPSQHLYLADSEINEIGSVFTGSNIFEVSPSGDTLVRSIESGNSEPTGITYNPVDGFFYVTNDDTTTITRYNASFSTPLTSVNTTAARANASDPEGIDVNPVNGDLFVAQGISGGRQVMIYNKDLQFLTSFSVADRVQDPEGIAYNPQTGLLYLVSTPDMAVFAYTTSGEFIEEYDLSGFVPLPVAPQGLTFGPTSNTSDAPTDLALYIADAMIDNVVDGRVYEAVLNNRPPVVDAGVDAIVMNHQAATLLGSVTDDRLPYPPGVTTANWSVLAGPGNVSFSNATSATTTATFDQAGTYVLQLAASDGQFTSTDEVSVHVVPAISSAHSLYFTVDTNVTLPGGISAADEDIVLFDGTNFSLWFDGSDVGLSAERLDAITVLGPSEFLFSLASSDTLPGVSGTIADADVIRFVGSTMGAVTSGTFSMYFDGSDVDLTTSSEDIDAFELLDDGSILISTNGSPTVGGISARDEDILRFIPSSLGPDTSGTWEWYLDASDVGLSAEDIDAVAIGSQGELYLSLVDGWVGAAGSVDNEDIVVFLPSALGSSSQGTFASSVWFDGSAFGLASQNLIAMDIVSTQVGLNVPPVALNDFITTQEDTSVVFSVLEDHGAGADHDPDGTLVPSSATILSPPSFGAVAALGNGVFQYIPARDYRGTDSFSYAVRDNEGALSNVATVTVQVSAVNDSPILSGLPDLAIASGSTNASIDLDNYFADVETPSTAATFQVQSSFSGITVSIDPVSHVLTVTADAGFEGEGDIVILATDGGDGASAALSDTDVLHVVVSSTVPDQENMFLVFDANVTVGGITAANEDIVIFDGANFAIHFDGSDVGLSAARIDGLAMLSETEFLLSFGAATTVPGITETVESADIVRFVASSLGDQTSGQFSLYFDGSDVGLLPDSTAANVDAVELLSNGHLIVSTAGVYTVGGITAADEDLLEFVPQSLGPNTTGNWIHYLDTSDLGASSEDVAAVAQDSHGTWLMAFTTDFLLGGTAGDDEDIVELTITQGGSVTIGQWGGLRFDGSAFGLVDREIRAFDVLPAITPLAASLPIADDPVINASRIPRAPLATETKAIDRALISLYDAKQNETTWRRRTGALSSGFALLRY